MKHIIVFLIIFSFFFTSINFVYASDNFKKQFEESAGITAAETGHIPDMEDQADLLTLIGQVVKLVIGLLGVFFLVLMIYGGYTWMLARGNEQEVEKAKNIITNAIIGLTIVLAAYAIAAYVPRIFLQIE